MAKHDLARVLMQRGEYGGAEKILHGVIPLLRKALGKHHLETLKAMAHLSVALRQRREYEDAEKILRKVVRRSSKALGDTHPVTLKATGDLATVLKDRGEYPEAEKLVRDLVSRSREAFGDTHHDTLTAMINLGTMLQRRREYTEAEELLKEVVQKHVNLYGIDHPQTLYVMGTHASLLMATGAHETAETCLRLLIPRLCRVLGDKDPQTLAAKNKLSAVLSVMCKHDEAQKLLRDLESDMCTTLGKEHPASRMVTSNLKSVMSNLNIDGFRAQKRRSAASGSTEDDTLSQQVSANEMPLPRPMHNTFGTDAFVCSLLHSQKEGSAMEDENVAATTNVDGGPCIDTVPVVDLEALIRAWKAARVAWEAAVEVVKEAQADLYARDNTLSKRSKELRQKETKADFLTKGTAKAVRLSAECRDLREVVEGARQRTEKARAALEMRKEEAERLNNAVDAALSDLNEADARRRGKPEKWRELQESGGTILRRRDLRLNVPSASTVVEQTAFNSIFNRGFDEKGDPIPCPPGVGDRWHGRKAVGNGKAHARGGKNVRGGKNAADPPDAPWVETNEESVLETFGAAGLDWLSTTTGDDSKRVVDTHALKAGVDSDNNNAMTPEQTPLHADSHWWE